MMEDENARLLLDALGVRVRTLRLERGLTQGQLEAASGIHRVSIVKLEAGGVDARTSTIHRIARALGVSMSDLLDGLGEGN